MIVGRKILADSLVVGGSEANLKHSTFDLTVGEIIPIGKDAVTARLKTPPQTYFIEPREMVWILSKEEFSLPNNITGVATLRTTFTKNGILALNVGIIDPLFHGPISTALINFSDRPRPIAVGDKFFRVLFLEHDDVSEFHTASEDLQRNDYVKHLHTVSYADFSKNFLNIPSFDDKFYQEKFWSIIFYGITKNKFALFPLLFSLILLLWFFIDLGLTRFLLDKLEWVTTNVQKIKFW